MQEKKTEGLLLQSIPYLGYQKIVKVLTKERGLLTFFVKKRNLCQMADPFLNAEWVYTSKEKEILSLKDISPTNTYQELRNSFFTLQTAGKMGKALLLTQKPENSSPGIYLLTLAYLKKLSVFENPEILLSSFYLKLLLHDGILGLDPFCTCGEKATFLSPQGSHCNSHQKPGSLVFSGQDWEVLHSLTFSRKFQDLETLILSNDLSKKVELLFSCSI